MRSDDEENLARDGEVLRVPMHMMDSVQRSLAATRGVHDGLGNTAGFRNGFVFEEDEAAAARRRQARDEYISRTSNAWRGGR